ncbi:hypothetical protein I4U23_013143 [Adineta vaga]|nr:hypothetical protein I4U23_013143 [Adineta vaga]
MKSSSSYSKGFDLRNSGGIRCSKSSCSIASLNKPVEELPDTCHRCEKHNRLWLARISTESVTNKPKRKRYVIQSADTKPSRSEDQKQFPELATNLSTTTKSCVPKSRIPIRAPGYTFSPSQSTIPTADNSSSALNKNLMNAKKISKIPRLIAKKPQEISANNEQKVCNVIDLEGIQLHVLETKETSKTDANLTEIPTNNIFTDISKLEGMETKTETKSVNNLNEIDSSLLHMTEMQDKIKIVSSIDRFDNPTLSQAQDQYHSDDYIQVKTNTNSKENNTLQHDNYNEQNEDILMIFKKEQEKLKAYYDNFPNINATIDESGPELAKAREFTKSILETLPSGDVNDRNTLCHILNIIYKTENEDCLFYDSRSGINLYDASANLADINSEDKVFILKLNSSKGLGNRNTDQTELDDLKLAQKLINVIRQNESDPIIDDILTRLSEAHKVNKEDVVIKNVFVGSFNILYTVLDLVKSTTESLYKISKKLEKQFDEFVSAKIHPLLFRPSFDIAYFDKRGNKTFDSVSKTYEVGPPERTKTYTTPSGWTRYGLKVLGKYSDDYWLHPFRDSRNWYRAFHGTGRVKSEDFRDGTGRAKSIDFGDGTDLSDPQYACVDALASIHVNEFLKAREHAYGEGVYCSPNPTFPENIAVNPDGIKTTEVDDIWVVPDPKDIRPYGILIKEA